MAYATGVGVVGSGGFSDYNSNSRGSDAPDGVAAPDYRSLERLKRDFLDYLGAKEKEIEEQKDARRFRHGSQYTSEQVTQLRQRRQPITTINEVSRKIHGIVGTLARLKQDAKAYPRTPKQEQGADLASAAIQYVLQEQEFDAKDPICSEMAAIDGIGGLEILLEQGDRGDHEIGLEIVFTDSFFYDPRSYRADFSDARFMGVAKWFDVEEAKEMWPDKADDFDGLADSGSELSTNADREDKWFQTTGQRKRVRVVEEWYKRNDKWFWCIYTGQFKVDEGESYLFDEKNRSQCKYIMWSAYVDQDGDRYGLVRDLKSLQMEVNMRHSKALYNMLSRRIISPVGAFKDVELARRESARSDGIVEYQTVGPNKPEFDDAARLAETEAQFKFLEYAHQRIENFGPNVAVVGQGLENSSGRAINLLQQAGMADLGPFIQAYRGWKIRVYRAVWNALQRYWTGERWVRVTDDDNLSQFIQVNGVGIDPQTGMPTMVNALGSLDVDIILDEGPDEINNQMDAYDTLLALASKGAQIPPNVLLELSPINSQLKKKLLDQLQPAPDPMQQQRAQIEMAHGQAKVQETSASAQLKQAQAVKTVQEARVVTPEQGQSPQMPEHPMTTQSNAFDKMASAALKQAQAQKAKADTAKTVQDIALEPQRIAMEARDKEMERAMAQQQAERNADINEMKARNGPNNGAR